MKYNIKELEVGSLHAQIGAPGQAYEVKDRVVGVNPRTALIYLVPLGFTAGRWHTIDQVSKLFLPYVKH